MPFKMGWETHSHTAASVDVPIGGLAGQLRRYDIVHGFVSRNPVCCIDIGYDDEMRWMMGLDLSATPESEAGQQRISRVCEERARQGMFDCLPKHLERSKATKGDYTTI